MSFGLDTWLRMHEYCKGHVTTFMRIHAFARTHKDSLTVYRLGTSKLVEITQCSDLLTVRTSTMYKGQKAHYVINYYTDQHGKVGISCYLRQDESTYYTPDQIRKAMKTISARINSIKLDNNVPEQLSIIGV